MFERRLKWFCILLAFIGVALIARLVDIQVLHAADYEALSSRLLTRPVRLLPAPRGAIYDRSGRPLVADEPACDICIHYGVLAGRSDYLWARARELRRSGAYPKTTPLTEIVDEQRVNIAHMWQRLGQLTHRPVSDFMEKAEQIRSGIERVRAAVQRSSGVVQALAEENMLHPLVEGIDNELALSVREELERYPWIRVVPGSRRNVRDADDLVHVLGRTGEATRELMDGDPLAADELRALRPGDRTGISGIERAADGLLRGTRGRIVEDVDRNVLEQSDPVRGRDVHLTIDQALQRETLRYLEEAVNETASPAGAAAVVIDVATREVLVLASYPTYHYDTFAADFDGLQRDTRRSPLLFRAVAAQYPPGSICKAITLIGALNEGVISESARIHCRGFLNTPDAFRCWIYNQHHGTTHDMMNPAGQNAEDAVRNSCNIYFYTVGERLGAGRLCEWFSRAGLGRTQGTGLNEEVAAIVPNEEWLMRRWHRKHQTADAWNFAIGQGEVTCTPLQAANVAATIAGGAWQPVTLVRDLPAEFAPRVTGAGTRFDEAALRVLRAGMWRVVNEQGGTAFVAKLDQHGYELCGKTGSAQTVPSVLTRRFTLRWPDGRREVVEATSRAEALARFAEPRPEVIGWRAGGRYPELGPDDRLPSHAWFIGFTQAAGTRRGAAPQGRVYAISVIIEFGGSGGRTAGPVAKRIAEMLLGHEE